ncbi:MAG: DinB family protein [Planctomycetota bacterium]
MNWTELLNAGIEEAYRSTEGLLRHVDDTMLAWKPDTGENWMTVGQLLRHLPEACGFCMRGFVTGEWGMPEGVDPADAVPESMLPTAEEMKSVESVDEAKRLLAEDKELAYAMVKQAGEDRLENQATTAPWDPMEMPLGRRLLGMIEHLAMHRAQLFYYLKLMGKPVNTHSLYGMD